MNDDKKKPILTKKEFWEKEWQNLDFPIVLDPNKRGDRSIMFLFDKYLSNSTDEHKNCMEIGCNPGKFIIYCGKNLNYSIFGLDYDEKGCAFTERNLDAAGVSGSISKVDIFDFNIEKRYDLVISLGFIEHFTDDKLKEALDIHIDLLKPGGKLFLSVPNFRYINYLFAYIFRKKMIEVHNLDVMEESFFLDIAREYNLEIQFLGYFGGLNPGGLKLGKSNIFKRFVTESLIGNFEKFEFLDNFNSKYFSHHLGAVYKKS